MPRSNYKRCKDCHRHADEVGELSHTCLCEDCGNKRRFENLDHLIAHRGSYFQHWRRRIVASAGGVLMDDLQAPR